VTVACMYLCQLNQFNEDNQHDMSVDGYAESAMQRNTSVERLNGNGDVPHSGWNEHASG